MISVITIDDSITPNIIIEYARRNISLPKIKSMLPVSIKYTVCAINNIYKILYTLLNGDEYTAIKYSIFVLSSEIPSERLDNSYTDLISKELNISKTNAELVNGFLDSIKSSDDLIHRKVLFYCSNDILTKL